MKFVTLLSHLAYNKQNSIFKNTTIDQMIPKEMKI